MGDWTQVFFDSGDTCYLTDTEENDDDDNDIIMFRTSCRPYQVTSPSLYNNNSALIFSSSSINSKSNITSHQNSFNRSNTSLFPHTAASKRNYSYKKTLEALDSLITQKPQKKTAHKQADNLEVMHWCTEKLKLDLSKLSVIHVAGTKGKGSTCAFCESILRSAGYKTGLFTSPHLVDVRERIRINGDLVDQNIFVEHFWENWDQLRETSSAPSMASYFRFLTLLAFKIFIAEQVDVAIIEVGIGGRLDATNVIPSPVVSGISSLALDHCNILGNTIDQIAFEKSGIIKQNRPVVSVPQVAEAMKVIQEKAKKESAHLTLIPDFEEFETLHHSSSPSVVDARQKLRLGINGSHQRLNASLALCLTRIWMEETNSSSASKSFFDPQENSYRQFEHYKSPFDIPVFPAYRLPHALVHGIADCHWPGRSQVVRIPGKNVDFYLDGAHTAESIEFCRDWFLSSTSSETRNDNNVQDTSSSGEDTGSNLLTRANVTVPPILDNNNDNDNNNKDNNINEDNIDDQEQQFYQRSKKKSQFIHQRTRRRIVVFNITGERDSQQLLVPFVQSRKQLSEIILCPTDSVKESLTKKKGCEQKYKLDRIQKEWLDLMQEYNDHQVPVSIVNSVDDLIDHCIVSTKTKNIRLDVLVTGSLYLVGDVLNKLRTKTKI